MARSSRVATTIVGTGRLARSLAPLLPAAGYRVVGVVGRRLAAARAVCGRRSSGIATTSLRRGAERGRLLLLAVADRSIAPVASALADLNDVDWKTRTVLHHAGALGLEPLEAVARAGASVGVLHPLQSLGVPALASTLIHGSRARIEGDRRGRAAARKLARALGMQPLPLDALTPDQRTAYHAAASLVSNDVLALVAIAAALLESVGLERRVALEALLPLAEGTLLQLRKAGLHGPLTGPATRGDVRTLRAHLRRLAAGAPEDREIHRRLSLRLARLALELGERDAARTLASLGGRMPRRGV